MSEVQPRPSATRGRGSIRAGRGGLSSRGGLRSTARQSNGDGPTSAPPVSLEEQGELGQLKKQYLGQLETLKELFPDWTDDDLVFALQETDGDLPSTIDRITEGSVSRFADVKKKTKEKKAKDTFTALEPQAMSTRARGGRGSYEGGRGGRGRGSERGRGGTRGGRGGAAMASGGGRTAALSTPTNDSLAWGSSADKSTAPGGWDEPSTTAGNEGTLEGQWGSIVTSEAAPTTASEGQKSSLIPEGATKSWASMLAQAKPPPAIPKPVQTTVLEPEHLTQAEEINSDLPATHDAESVPPSSIIEDVPPAEENFVEDEQVTVPETPYQDEAESAADLGSSMDRLTEDNVERLPDESGPASTETVASTMDATSMIGRSTPYGSSQQVPTLGRPPMGGYATTAWKATGAPGRSSSFQRMMEQREAVVMPGNHAVDRAAVQFGQMGLNGDSKPLDVDEDREEAETRAQPPQQSPPPQPKTSLPPVHQQASTLAEQAIDQGSPPTPKQVPGLPPPSQATAPSIATQQPLSMPPGISQPHTQGMQPFGQYSRYASGPLGQESSTTTQKPYDPFSQQLNYSQGNPETQAAAQSSSQTSGQIQSQGQPQHGGLSQGQNEFAQQQYTGDQQRNTFQGYFGSSYGQQSGTTLQENAPPQRTPSGLGASDSGYGTSQSAPNQSRFGEVPSSEPNTSGSTMANQQQAGPMSQQNQPMHQQAQGQAGHGGGYPYGNPYYGGSYYGTYMNQQYPNYQYNQQGYAAPFGGKGGMYGQLHHGYGLSPQTSYEHSSTPGTSSGLGNSSLQGRDSTFGGGLGDYGRSTSSQTQTQQHGSSYNSFPGDHPDSFGRSPSGMVSQYGQQQSDSTLKPFQDQKSGTSPSLGPPGRTGSAANNGGYGGTQSNFPPPQSQSGFSGYPSHINQLHNNHGSQYGGFGGLGGGHQGNAQSHQGGGYGTYGGGGFGNNYGNYGRGGWGGNYGH